MKTENITLVTWYFPEFLSTAARGQLHAEILAFGGNTYRLPWMQTNVCLFPCHLR